MFHKNIYFRVFSFLYSLQLTQQFFFFIYIFNVFISTFFVSVINHNFFFHSIIKLLKILSFISAFFLILFGKNEFVKSPSILLFNIKWIHLFQMYPHITAYACVLLIFATIFLIPIHF